VVGLTGVHMMMARWRRAFAEDRNQRPQRFFRIMNEVPTLLMIGIVIFVVVKPF
jgi:putative membrane protein